jgi:hypothetical protein
MNFLIFAPSYSPNNGGAIALHKLCHILVEIGHNASIFPMIDNLELNKFNYKQSIRKLIKNQVKNFFKPFRTSPRFKTPITQKLPQNFDEYIVIYPEITFGNPLKAKNVVRWLLHNPGFHSDTIFYGKNELYFKYHDGFDHFTYPGSKTSDLILQIEDYPFDIYNEFGSFSTRTGSAYLIRKGYKKTIQHDLSDSIQIDGKSHEEIAKIFKRVKTFISYDTNSAYSYFAVLCGCDSIVIPNHGVTKEEWFPNPKDRYGIAYGYENLEEAKSTKHLLLPYKKSLETITFVRVEECLLEMREFFNLNHLT